MAGAAFKNQGENVKLFTLFIVSSVFLFSSSWGDFTEDEIKKAWTETGFDFETLNGKLTVEICYQSEKKFSACLMAFHELLSEAVEDEPHQLRVSPGLNKLEIVPFSKPDHLTLEDVLASDAKRRESFRLLFRTQPPLTEEFHDIVQQILKFTRKIPLEAQSRWAGKTYNAYLGEAFDPKTTLHPLELINPKFNEDSVDVGAFFPFYELENGEIAMTVHPFEGSPAKVAGLRDGDLILSVDDFDVRGLSFHDPQVRNEFLSRLKGPMDSEVRFRVLGFCDTHEKEIVVNRGLADEFVNHWLESKRFVNLTQQEPVEDCKPESLSTESPSVGQIPKDQDSAGSVELQASYLPLKTFQFPQRNSLTDAAISVLTPYYFSTVWMYPVCAEFLLLQTIDINNPFSRGMIIDFRDNEGGNFHEVACMLNTLIQSDKIMARYLPIKDGEIVSQSDESETYYFTEGGFPSANPKLPLMTYNRNIVVIVNQRSYSAAEIFAGIIQDTGRGWVIGDRTFGKGIAEEAFPMQLPSKSGDESNPPKPLQLRKTTGIYILGSGRSPQGAGIIPDFRFSSTGEPIENEVDYVSLLDQVFFNNIQFENTPWEQSRPGELAKLSDCISKPGRMGQTLKEKIRKDGKYGRPFVTDYLLELAKDILFCAPPRPSFVPSPYLSPLYDVKYEK